MKTSMSLKTGVPMILSFFIVLIVLVEIFGVYMYWYRNMHIEVPEAVSDNIVRVDLHGYRAVNSFFGGLIKFAPNEDAAQAGNPFTYR